ncbi:MAG: FeoB-associated Cys-rich membrane protein [Oscillospiraceae bacterium]|nr:FeoB-associated Cys-rich membrane protein [Oscillospiraceae bacterium]
MLDFILFLLTALAVFNAFRICIRRKKQGKSCCGDCSQCSGCHHGESP